MKASTEARHTLFTARNLLQEIAECGMPCERCASALREVTKLIRAYNREMKRAMNTPGMESATV